MTQSWGPLTESWRKRLYFHRPVSEGSSIGAGTRSGALSLEKLEAMTSGSVGLDMIAIPGGTPAATISGIIAVEMKQPDTMTEPFDP